MEKTCFAKEYRMLLFEASKEGKRVEGLRLDGSRFSGVPEVWQNRQKSKQVKEDHPDYGEQWFIGYGLVLLREIKELKMIK